MQFKEITGQQETAAKLVQGVTRGRISHAQLFIGGEGVGALPLAIAYAQYLNCTDRRDGDSCGQCPSCRQIAQLAHPDVHFVFPVNTPKGKSSGEKPLSDASCRSGGGCSKKPAGISANRCGIRPSK